MGVALEVTPVLGLLVFDEVFPPAAGREAVEPAAPAAVDPVVPEPALPTPAAD